MVIKNFDQYDEIIEYITERVSEDIVLRDLSRVLAKAYAEATYPAYPEAIMADWSKFQGMSNEDIYEYERARAFNRLIVGVA